jgi:hypothetical protein
MKIFINYRRDDVPNAVHMIAQYLMLEYGPENVFYDRQAIKKAEVFTKSIENALDNCLVLIAVIGKNWHKLLNTKKAFNENDFVLFEIEKAMENGVTILPILVDNVEMPPKDMLPPEIRELSLINALDYMSDLKHQDKEKAALIMEINEIIKNRKNKGGLSKVKESNYISKIKETINSEEEGNKVLEYLKINPLKENYCNQILNSKEHSRIHMLAYALLTDLVPYLKLNELKFVLIPPFTAEYFLQNLNIGENGENEEKRTIFSLPFYININTNQLQDIFGNSKTLNDLRDCIVNADTETNQKFKLPDLSELIQAHMSNLLCTANYPQIEYCCKDKNNISEFYNVMLLRNSDKSSFKTCSVSPRSSITQHYRILINK